MNLHQKAYKPYLAVIPLDKCAWPWYAYVHGITHNYLQTGTHHFRCIVNWKSFKQLGVFILTTSFGICT